MRVLHPELAPWALLLPLLVACWAVYRWRRATFRRRAPIAPRFARLSRRTSSVRDVATLALGLLAAGALVFSLVRPQLLLTTRVPEYERQDLIVMLDRSASMRAHDIAPSRFARATMEIRNVVRQKPEGIGRIGLVGFAEASVVLSYLTEDVDSVLFYLDWIDGDTTPLFGTNMGAALTSAMDVAAKDDKPTRKLLLLVSDGEDQSSELAKALAAVRARDVHVSFIGVGSDQSVPIPLLAASGPDQFLKDDAGRAVTTRFSETTLRTIAATTGGRYARSTTGHELRDAFADILHGERRLLGWRTSVEYRDLYPAGLAVAAIAGALLWLWS